MLLERSFTLEPTASSVGTARHLLREALAGVGHSEWIEAGELAVSEVVTNAVLHAHTPCELTIQVLDTHARIEVRDSSPSLPRAREYGTQATTGRGMSLIAAVTQEHGIEPLGSAGKIVWFCLGDPPEIDIDSLLDAWEDTPEPEHVSSEKNWELVLVNMPAALWLSAQRHHDAMLRELVLLREGGGSQTTNRPATGEAFARADAARTQISRSFQNALTEAAARGDLRSPLPPGHPSPLEPVPDNLTLRVPLDHDAARGLSDLQDLLDEAEGRSHAGEMLVYPGLPEIIAVRDWVCEQGIAQASGILAHPWTPPPMGEADLPGRGTDVVAGEFADLLSTERGLVIADQGNRILGVSASLASTLGWSPHELEGRRIVVLIPERLREAHVAGFSRHLTTGETHVIGVPLQLPVLCRDGREMMCDFLIQQRDVGERQHLYLAWIEPVRTPASEGAGGEASQ